MVLGSHVIFGAYGFWLPNDPRGSWSDFVGSWELFQYGTATKTSETQSVAHRPHDAASRQAAKKALKHPPVEFTGTQARGIGCGFGLYAEKAGLIIWACAILPNHVHLVLGRHRLKVESLVIQLKGDATERLIAEQVHPFADRKEKNGRHPKCFARGEWKVFLDTPEHILRAIRYVEGNPEKEGKPRQRWRFVTPFDPSAV